MPVSSVRHNYPDIIPEPQANKKRELHMFFLKNRKRCTAPKYEEIPMGEPTVPPFRFRLTMTFDGEDVVVEETQSNKKESQHECASVMLEKLEELKDKNPAPLEKFRVTLASGMKVKVKQNVENYAGMNATLEKYLSNKEKWGMILAGGKRIALHKDSFEAVGAATKFRTGLPVELLSVNSNQWLKGSVTSVKGEKISVRYTENGQTRNDTFSPDDPRIRRCAVTARTGAVGNLGPLDIDALPATFLDNEFRPILVQQLKSFVPQKMGSVDGDFIDYVKVLIKNKHSQLQFKNDLQAFFGQQKAEAFSGWLWAYLGEVIRRVKRSGNRSNLSTVTKEVSLRYVNKKVGTDFRYQRNGWRVTSISSGAQPNLIVGDLITAIAGQSIVGKAESEQIKIFKNNLRHEVPLTVTRKQTVGTVRAAIQYVNNQLGVDFEYNTNGWRITSLGSAPGQPNLKVGDNVIAVNDNSIVGRGETQQAQIFKANLRNGAIFTVQRAGVSSNALPQLPPVNYGLPKQAISAIGGGTVRIRVLNSQIGIGFKYHGQGWQIVHLENRPGQPGLAIGDIVTHIGGEQITGLAKENQMQIFANNIKNGCEVTIKRTGATLAMEQMIIDFYPTIQAEAGDNAPPPCKIDTSLKGKIIQFSLKGEKFFAKISSIRNVADYPYQLQYLGSGQPSEYVHIDPDSMRLRDQNRHVLPFTFTTASEVSTEQSIIASSTAKKSVFERQMGLFGRGGGGGGGSSFGANRRTTTLASGVPSWWGNADRGKETFEAVYGRRPGGGGGGRRGRSSSPGARGGRRSGRRGMAAGVSWSRSRSRSPARKRKGRRRFAAKFDDSDEELDEFDDAAAKPRGRRSRRAKSKAKPTTKKWDARKGRYVAAAAAAADSDSEMWDSDDTYEDY